MLSLEFATNMFGPLKPDMKKRLMAVINKPSQRTWDNAYSIILNSKTETLWDAVLAVNPFFVRRKPLDEPWPAIPTKQDIIAALQYATLKQTSKN
jgi:hypothetical protein